MSDVLAVMPIHARPITRTRHCQSNVIVKSIQSLKRHFNSLCTFYIVVQYAFYQPKQRGRLSKVKFNSNYTTLASFFLHRIHHTHAKYSENNSLTFCGIPLKRLSHSNLRHHYKSFALTIGKRHCDHLKYYFLH